MIFFFAYSIDRNRSSVQLFVVNSFVFSCRRVLCAIFDYHFERIYVVVGVTECDRLLILHVAAMRMNEIS